MNTIHQVTLKQANKESNTLKLTVIDSLSKTAESVIVVPYSSDGTLQIGGKKDQLCLV